ncbi:Hsp20/alpha crystallin family protein [Rehaibacterium terrae]|jgi:HSP20 family protein|uniref:HSP20 family protein n=1 Tax=Rehaibacterium terrae TaxID=1341696 RepID=A0A7W7XY99_9GAMM|nr:Hsp20/alpha crystallin family protein [Rehaibacterium terrae]MBB5014390.1 HSP20 family protein [Rehaibacterium terrae]
MGMALELSRLSPWNWFRRDESAGTVPMSRGGSDGLLPVSRLQREIDRLFDDVFRDFGMPRMTMPTTWMPGFGEDFAGVLRPQLDIIESKDAYTITVEVPGVERDDLQLSLADGCLTIAGQKKREQRSQDQQVHRIERAYGAFQRVLDLPADADAERITASHRNGVLTVTVPRKPGVSAVSGRRIDIQAA